ncbi:hypothetical protein CATMIT_02638 [Catenibacterium mitsuokai DSM 15897]|nr:hypothetical protein CATMIT_02638 [Catenibacterium mitsuokai DSM 15897]
MTCFVLKISDKYHIIRYSKFIFLVLKGNIKEILKQMLQKNLLPH